ncbi:MAG TPA: biotin--[acetyl-CoA-carboxylase] ligase [Fimbriimonas sp.]|nr:biotin--[acetyl-CoA-carboxylase] ligase [Fimbriimonas sp.]
MRSPLEDGCEWLILEGVESTQKVAEGLLREGSKVGIVLAREQTQGRGRFGRSWLTGPNDSLTMTMIYRPYAAHPAPHLVGMAVALAVASSIHCQLQWPNDLVIEGKKVGGILTELKQAEGLGLVPLVGIGINLNQDRFPAEIEDRAVSLHQAHGGQYKPEEVAFDIVERLSALPEPMSWSDLAPVWSVFDKTPGKQYTLPNREKAQAIAIGSGGQLLCSVNGESHSVLAADAIFGTSSS